MLQKCAGHQARHRRETLQKFIQRIIVITAIKQRLSRDARAFEHGRAAVDVWVNRDEVVYLHAVLYRQSGRLAIASNARADDCDGFVHNVKCLTGLFAILKGRDFSPAPCIKISLRVFSTMTRPPCQLEIADVRFLELTKK